MKKSSDVDSRTNWEIDIDCSTHFHIRIAMRYQNALNLEKLRTLQDDEQNLLAQSRNQVNLCYSSARIFYDPIALSVSRVAKSVTNTPVTSIPRRSTIVNPASVVYPKNMSGF